MTRAIKSKSRDPFEVENALHHLTRAEEIRRDSNLMGHVQKLAASKKASLSKLARAPRSTSVKSK